MCYHDSHMKTRHVFLSPHLDDAVFSAAGLILDLKKKKNDIFIVSVFTSFGERPISTDAQVSLLKSGCIRLSSFGKLRMREDDAAMRALGVPFIRLGFVDAGFRKTTDRSFIYPTFKQLFSGSQVAEPKLFKNILQSLTGVLRPNDVIYAPLGIGNHPDHILVREATQTITRNVLFWADLPYACNLRTPLPDREEWTHAITITPSAAKTTVASMYRSQFFQCFPKGLEHIQEKFFTRQFSSRP